MLPCQPGSSPPLHTVRAALVGDFHSVSGSDPAVSSSKNVELIELLTKLRYNENLVLTQALMPSCPRNFLKHSEPQRPPLNGAPITKRTKKFRLQIRGAYPARHIDFCLRYLRASCPRESRDLSAGYRRNKNRQIHTGFGGCQSAALAKRSLTWPMTLVSLRWRSAGWCCRVRV